MKVFRFLTSFSDIGYFGSVHEKLDFSATIAAIQLFRAKYPETSGVYIENRANGAAAINTLSEQVPGINKVSPSKSKYYRAFASSAFPRGKHDDWLDSWTQSRGALSGDVVADYSMFTAENVARFEANLMRMGYSSEHFIPRGAGRGKFHP